MFYLNALFKIQHDKINSRFNFRKIKGKGREGREVEKDR